MWVSHEAETISHTCQEGPAEGLGFVEGRDSGEAQFTGFSLGESGEGFGGMEL